MTEPLGEQGGEVTSGDGAKLLSRDRSLRFLLLGFMAAMVLVTFGAIVWMLRRGFDWTDEAFVYTLIASNRIAVDLPLGFQHLLHPLYVATGQSVLVFRIFRLAGYILLSVGLIWTAQVVLRRIGVTISRSGWVLVLLVGQVGTFLAWSYPPQYLSYNELASWLVQVGVALILLSLAWGVSSPQDQAAPWVLWSVWAGLGAVSMLLMFAKVTSGLAFGAILVLALAIPNPGHLLWKRLVSVGGGGAAALFAFWVTGCPIAAYFRNVSVLVFSTSAQDGAGHSLSGMITSYVTSLQSTGQALVPSLLAFSLAMATLRRRRKPGRDRGREAVIDAITWILGALLLLALVTLPRTPVLPYLGVLISFIGAAGFIGLGILGMDGATLHASKVSRILTIAFAGAVLVAAPFVSAVGTNMPLTPQFLYAGTLWCVVFGIALVRSTRRLVLRRSSASSLPALVGCVVILMAAMAVKAYIVTPYRSLPLTAQDTSASVPELRGILLTRTDAAWVDRVSAQGHSLGAAGVPTIAIDAAGALYVFNQSGYASPWAGHGNLPAGFTSVRLACANRPADLLLLQPGTADLAAPATIGMTKSLAACGIRFPGDFRVVDQILTDSKRRTLTIWRLKTK